MSLEALGLYLICEYSDENTWRTYQGDLLWAAGTGFHFAKSNEPRKPSKYTTEPTYPRYYELCYAYSIKTIHSQNKQTQNEPCIFDTISSFRKMK